MYENLFNFLKTLKVDGRILCTDGTHYQAWPDQLVMDQKWVPILEKFYRQMQSNKFVFVKYQNEWYHPKDVWFIRQNEMTAAEFKAVERFLECLRVPFATIPEAITKPLTGKCKWMDKIKIAEFIRYNPNQYEKLGMEVQCNLLSYVVKTAEDLKLLINQRPLPLANGFGYFQLLHKNTNPKTTFYIPTEEIPASLLPSTQRNVNEEFFKQNEEFRLRLRNIFSSKGLLSYFVFKEHLLRGFFSINKQF